MSNIGDGAPVPDKIAGCGFLKMGVEDTVQATCLVLIAIHTVLDVLWCVAGEVIGLTLHWAYAGIEKEELDVVSIWL